MALRRRYDIVIIVLLVLTALAYASLSREFRLQADMPVQFFDSSHFSRGERASEEKIAKAYWNCAARQLQWKYGFASRLPADPPPEFSVSSSEIGPVAKNDAVRRHYWLKLRTIWNVSSVWKTEYGWSSSSFRERLRAAGEWWSQVARDIFVQW